MEDAMRQVLAETASNRDAAEQSLLSPQRDSCAPQVTGDGLSECVHRQLIQYAGDSGCYPDGGFVRSGSLASRSNSVTAELGLLTVGSPVRHWVVRAVREVSYELRFSQNVLDPANPALLEGAVAHADAPIRRFVVTDSTVDQLYGERIRAYFDANDVYHQLCVLDPGEENKTLDSAQAMAAALDEFGIDRRREPVIGIGGGVLMDLVGFVSSTYRRATPYLRVPTTLIGLVDAGVGAKTGVNFGHQKNRIGSYFPADRTLLDRTFLETLPRRHLSNGMAEVLKIALIKDSRLFELLEAHGPLLLDTHFRACSHGGVENSDSLPLCKGLMARSATRDPATEVIERAVQAMVGELAPNLWEAVLERVVDYGHSFSPSIEMVALPTLLHGEAVNIDMALTTLIAERRGLVTARQRQRVFAVMRDLELPIWHPLCSPQLLMSALRETVRHRDGAQRIPLPVGIGAAVFVNNLDGRELTAAAITLAGHQESGCND